METTRLKPSLERFLMENDAYKKFMLNVNNDTPNITSIDEINERNGFSCFLCAFVWRNTPEGVRFWLKLASEFSRIDCYGDKQ